MLNLSHESIAPESARNSRKPTRLVPIRFAEPPEETDIEKARADIPKKHPGTLSRSTISIIVARYAHDSCLLKEEEKVEGEADGDGGLGRAVEGAREKKKRRWYQCPRRVHMFV